ncbi:MAG: RtcB family protein [Halanaerobiaceae bacterium]
MSPEKHRQSPGKVKVISSSGENMLDESPLAYKNIESVIESLVQTGLAQPQVQLKPIIVLKG